MNVKTWTKTEIDVIFINWNWNKFQNWNNTVKEKFSLADLTLEDRQSQLSEESVDGLLFLLVLKKSERM
jgi:hypothetical protein